MGTADCQVSDVAAEINLIFNHRAHLDDSTINITGDYFIGSEMSDSLGYDSITILKGIYDVDFSTYSTYGEADFDVSLVGD